MEYTLDTSTIRRRFDAAIIGIHPDGCMAILLEQATGDIYMDIVSGGRCAKINLTDVYTAIIRPGEGCFVQCGRSWEEATYYGLTGNWAEPFYACVIGDTVTTGHSTIRPLPAAETEAVEIGPKYAGDDSKDFWRRVNALPEPDHMAAYSVGVALQNMEGTALNFINRCERNAASSEITVEPESNPLLTRLTAAEQELAAIRAEMEGTK